jgi:hypothetical protein
VVCLINKGRADRKSQARPVTDFSSQLVAFLNCVRQCLCSFVHKLDTSKLLALVFTMLVQFSLESLKKTAPYHHSFYLALALFRLLSELLTSRRLPNAGNLLAGLGSSQVVVLKG